MLHVDWPSTVSMQYCFIPECHFWWDLKLKWHAQPIEHIQPALLPAMEQVALEQGKSFKRKYLVPLFALTEAVTPYPL